MWNSLALLLWSMAVVDWPAHKLWSQLTNVKLN
jgi:hypothetical protein